MRRTSIFVLAIALVFAGCERPDNARTYEVRGIVRGFAPDRSTVDIEHENIPGFMPSMTMPFTPRDPKEIAKLTLNDAVQFQLHIGDRDSVITDIKKIAASDVHLPQPKPTAAAHINASPRLKEGDAMPVFTLTNEQGQKITLESYRGRPFVITFIFTRCPVPNFCPRMSNNFAELQKAIASGTGALAETKLLSITLDPQFDTPAILNEYGAHAGADQKIWNFATGDPAEIDELTHEFSIYRQNEGGTLSHGLATALIDCDGNVTSIWRGNAWQVDEVVQAIEKLNDRCAGGARNAK